LAVLLTMESQRRWRHLYMAVFESASESQPDVIFT